MSYYNNLLVVDHNNKVKYKSKYFFKILCYYEIQKKGQPIL